MFKGTFLLDMAHFVLGASGIQRCQTLFSLKSEIYIRLSSATAVTGTLIVVVVAFSRGQKHHPRFTL